MSHDPSTPSRRQPVAEDLSAPQTQIVRDREAYLGQGGRDIGRRLTDDQVELFVSGDPAAALQREFERLSPKFIALHDVGTSSSLRLLASMVATRNSRLQRLSVRRQGQGVALATLQFVEISAPDGSVIRAYSTDIDADSHSRHQMARLLLSHSTLGVLVFGDLPPHAQRAALQPLLDTIATEPWPNRELLLMPLGASASLASHASAFSSLAPIAARVTPQASRPADAWNFIGGAWNRMHGPAPEPHPPAPPSPPPAPMAPPIAAGYTPMPPRPAALLKAASDSEAPTQPMGLHGRPQTPSVAWGDYVQRCAAIKGMISCCVFERLSGKVLAHNGGRPSAEQLQAMGDQWLTSAGEMGLMLGAGVEISEAQLTFPGHHLLLHVLPAHPGVVLHAMLDAHIGNLALARVQIQRADPT
jgi:hypothetical protein